MDTFVEAPAGRRRRRHSDEFKASVIQACRQPGVSIAAVALANGLNANMLRKWAVDAEGAARSAVTPRSNGEMAQAVQPPPTFVPLALPPPAAAPADIRVELRRGGMLIAVTWPSAAAAECAQWMRELLK